MDHVLDGQQQLLVLLAVDEAEGLDTTDHIDFLHLIQSVTQVGAQQLHHFLILGFVEVDHCDVLQH